MLDSQEAGKMREHFFAYLFLHKFDYFAQIKTECEFNYKNKRMCSGIIKFSSPLIEISLLLVEP